MEKVLLHSHHADPATARFKSYCAMGWLLPLGRSLHFVSHPRVAGACPMASEQRTTIQGPPVDQQAETSQGGLE